MDFRFDEDQLAWRDTVRSFCARHASLSDVASREGKPADPTTWAGLAALGVLGILTPGDADSEGTGIVEATIAFEELGTSLMSGPVLWSTITAPLLDDVATGTLRVTGVQLDRWFTGPFVIDHVDECETVVIVRDEAVVSCERSELPQPANGEPLDPLTPSSVFETLPGGRILGDAETSARLRLHGTILSSASLVGVAQGALDVASSYALEREQFGVPIGSFQAIKHILADMYVRVGLARSATLAAAALMDGTRVADSVRAASAAKLLAGEAALDNGRAAVQVLGGMGFTWDMLPHYYLKRAWVLENSFGSGRAHALGISTLLENEVRNS